MVISPHGPLPRPRAEGRRAKRAGLGRLAQGNLQTRGQTNEKQQAGRPSKRPSVLSSSVITVVTPHFNFRSAAATTTSCYETANAAISACINDVFYEA
jgi:hypothetical protein